MNKLTINYTKISAHHSHYFIINDKKFKFRTKSEEEVRHFIDDVKKRLENFIHFDSVDDWYSDVFYAFEYHATCTPKLVEGYFHFFRTKLVESKKSVSRVNLFIQATKGSENWNSLEVRKNKLRLGDLIQSRRKYIKNLMDVLSPFKSNSYSEVKQKQGFTCDTTTGKLKCLKLFSGGISILCSLDGFEQRVRTPKDAAFEDVIAALKSHLENINRIVNNNTREPIFDATDKVSIGALGLYSKRYKYKIENYYRRLLLEFVSNGKWLIKESDNQETNRVWMTKSNFREILCAADTTEKKIVLSRLIGGKSYKEIYLGISIIADCFEMVYQETLEMPTENNKFDLQEDVWYYFYMESEKRRFRSFNFSTLKNNSIKRTCKLYLKSLLVADTRTKSSHRKSKKLIASIAQFNRMKQCISYFIEEHSVNAIAEITPSMMDQMLKSILYTNLGGRFRSLKNPLNSCTFLTSQLKAFFDWVISNAEKIGTPKPASNITYGIHFNEQTCLESSNKTDYIPEVIITQWVKNMHLLKPLIYKRILMTLINTPRRFGEICLLERGCITPHIKNGMHVTDQDKNMLYLLTFSQDKLDSNKILDQRNLDSIKKTTTTVVNHIVANEIEKHEDHTKKIESKINAKRKQEDKIHITKLFVGEDIWTKNGFSLVPSSSFTDAINTFSKQCDIRNENGDIWHFTPRQTRAYGALKIIENGGTCEDLSEALCHKSRKTTTNHYLKINDFLVNDINSAYYREEFDSKLKKNSDAFSGNEIQALFFKFCLENRKIFYNRKLLGLCGLKAAEKCPSSNHRYGDNEEDFPCATCTNLWTGSGCESGWQQLLDDQKEKVAAYEEFFTIANVEFKKHFNVPGYSKAKLKEKQAHKVVRAINGGSYNG